MEAPEYVANTITAYEINPRDVYGTFHGEERYDLLSIIIIRLSKSERAEKGNQLIKMLTVLLSDTMDVEKKKKILEEEHGMRITQKMERRMKSMCNLSEGILERGELRNKCHTVRKLRENMSSEDMINFLPYEEGFVKRVLVLLEKYPNATDEELMEMLQKKAVLNKTF